MRSLYPPSVFPPNYVLHIDFYNHNAKRKAAKTTIELRCGSKNKTNSLKREKAKD